MMKLTKLAVLGAGLGYCLALPAHLVAAPVSPEERAEQVLRQLTFEEKVGLLHGPMTRFVPKAKRPEGVAVGAGYIKGVPRLGVPHLIETDASLGVSNLMDMRKGDVATALPSGLALASSWDPDLIEQGGKMIGSEARAKGFNVMLVGGVNLVRDPRAGRNFEYLGEDPLLGGVLVGAQIRGVQSNNIIGTIKHFALNNQETGRNVASVEMDEATMRETELLAFEIGIEQGNPGSVMCAYNRVGGIYTCEHPFLLNDVLRRDWGYKGFVMSDWGAVHSTEAILAGLDQQSGEQLDGKKYFSDLLVQAVNEDRIPVSAVDNAARRVLYSIYAHGLAEHPLLPGVAIDYEANAKVAQQSAEEGIVLLKNKSNLLPLNKKIKSIAIIGGHADLGVPSGGGSSQVTPVGEFKKIGKGATSGPAATFALRGYSGTAPLDGLRELMPETQFDYLDGTDVAAAVALAKKADLAIVFAEKYATEALDHTDLNLDEGQDQLIAAVSKANRKTVVVLQTGNPIVMPWADKVPAIVSAWYSGQKGGLAIARVLLGEVNPSGHLPVTFPRSIEQLPNQVLPGSDAPPADKETRALYGIMAGTKPFDIHYAEGAEIGYRWFHQQQSKPLYPFGHGLSYTRFKYSDLKATGGKQLVVNFTIKNVGKHTGADVPQVYVVRPDGTQRLIGWAKPKLEPKQEQQIRVQADLRVIADFDPTLKSWVIPAGQYRVQVGESATDISLNKSVSMDAVALSL